MEDQLDAPLAGVLQTMQDGIMSSSSYFGIKTLKSPIDAWIYQELLFECKPDVIVEIGNYHGGSALYFAHICDALGKGRVIGVDLSHSDVPQVVRSHPRISLMEGDAIASFALVRQQIAEDESVLVIEDSAHTFDNTLAVMRRYAALVKPGGYLIVEDSICHHGLDVGPNPGPYEAIDAFLNECSDFKSDRSRERFLITWNPKGYLKRGG